MDYKLPDKSKNETYPLTWFYATNLHVARALSSEQSYAPYQFDPRTNIITAATVLRYYPVGDDKNLNGLGQVGAGPTYANPNASQPTLIKNAKLLYMGEDFLKSKPADFFPQYFSADLEEFIDFAVFEVTFENAAEAKSTTQDYFNEKQKFGFRRQSYLTQRTTN